MFKRVGVYIGRFQPFHNGHAHVIEEMIADGNDKLIILVGSSHQSRSPKNPWNFKERQKIIQDHIAIYLKSGTEFVVQGIRDFIHDSDWEVEVQRIVKNHTEEKDHITIYNSSKDTAYAYEEKFAGWEGKVLHSNYPNINSTEIREKYYNHGLKWIEKLSEYLPESTFDFLREEVKTDLYLKLKDEYDHLENYKKQWSGLKHPVTFVTVDCVILNHHNKVALVRRKEMPGRGYYALPGGFVKPTETLVQAAVRCAKDKAGIILDKNLVYHSVVFDQPDRSLRGRTITHTFLFKLGINYTPLSNTPNWINVNQLFMYEEEIFEDHKLIIESLV